MTILQFPNRTDHLPSLAELCLLLSANYQALNTEDRNLFALLYRIHMRGNKATIADVNGARANAWSMCNRYGLGLDL